VNRVFLNLGNDQVHIRHALEKLEPSSFQASTDMGSETDGDFLTSCGDIDEARIFALSVIEFECSSHRQENDGIDLTITVEIGRIEDKAMRLVFELSKEGERGSISYTVRVHKSDDGIFNFFGDPIYRELLPVRH